MLPHNLREWVPSPIKHPLITCTRWFWEARGRPAQSTKDISLIKALLSDVTSDTLRVWEWGAGRSTIYYTKFLKSMGRDFEWHAVDNSKSWFDKCESEISRNALSNNVRIYHSEFPAFWELPGYSPGNPIPPDSRTGSTSVSKYVNMPNEAGGPFDVIIVDGRYRRRCLLVAKEVLAPGGIVLLHDAQRAHYHSSLDVFPHVRFLATGNLPGTKQESTVALCTLSDNLPYLHLPGKYGQSSKNLPNRGIPEEDTRDHALDSVRPI